MTIHTARPGVLIGKAGADIAKLNKKLSRFTDSDVHVNIAEIRKPEIDATLVAEGIAQQLERRVAFRRAMKRAMQSAQRLGALGIRINSSGRLAGAEIARMEWYREGQVPLHTLRADIDYGTALSKQPMELLVLKSGSTKVKYLSMIQWLRKTAPRKCKKVAAVVVDEVDRVVVDLVVHPGVKNKESIIIQYWCKKYKTHPLGKRLRSMRSSDLRKRKCYSQNGPSSVKCIKVGSKVLPKVVRP